MIRRNRNFYTVVTELQSELPIADKLFVLPTFSVIIRCHTREPLCHFVQVVAVFFKVFVAAATAQHLSFNDVELPVDIKCDAITTF